VICSPRALVAGKGYRPWLDSGDNGQVGFAEVGVVVEEELLGVSLLGVSGVFEDKVSEDGVGREMRDDIRPLEKSPDRALRNGMVIDAIVPFPSPFEAY